MPESNENLVQAYEYAIQRAIALTAEIAERKKIESALHESEENFRALADSAAAGIVILIENGKHVYANNHFCEITGYTLPEVINIAAADILSPDEREKVLGILHKRLSGQPDVPSQYETTFVRKDGNFISVEITSVRTVWKGMPASLVVVNDITQRKKMEEHLQLTDRLASIGEMSSGIAHEASNPLTNIIGIAELLLESGVPDEIKKDIEIISSEAQRTARIIKDLLTFTRKHPQERKLTEINDVIRKVLEMRVSAQRLNNITVNTCFAAVLPEVMADYFQLQQVFLNIIINAEYFMYEAHKKGILTIVTEQQGDIIRASFSDNGPGISQENLKHIFEPFFTTKEVTKGTGLGLSICYSIITAHNGRVYAESEPGKGATFIIELPIAVTITRE